MKKGIIRRRGSSEVIGRWRADQQSLVVETDDTKLRRAADEVLKTAQSIPVHAAQRHAGLSYSEDVIESPAKLKYLALFALEMEERGFEVDPDEEDEEEEYDDEDEEEYADNNSGNNDGNDDGNDED